MTEPLSYKINQINKQLFIEHTADDAKEAVIKLLNSIIHISYETFIEQINKNLNEVINYKLDNRPIFVYMNKKDKDKSSFWMFLLIEKILIKKYIEIKLIYDFKEVKNDDIVLLVDDCIYSGSQISNTIYSLLNKLPVNKRINLMLFIPYMSLNGKNRILEVFKEKQYKNFIITNHIEILPLSEYLTEEEAKNIFNYYYQIKYDKELEKYLIYFDHKVADNISSHPYIFNGTVPNTKNKEIIQQIYEFNKQYYDDNDNKLTKLENQYNNTQNKDEKEKIEKELEEHTYLQNERYKIKIKLEKLLDLFPLLTNCEHIEKTLDFEESVCPIPPYKDDYPQFLDKVKKITEKKTNTKRNSYTSDWNRSIDCDRINTTTIYTSTNK